MHMDRLADLLSQLAAEHERLRCECESLRADAKAWRAERPADDDDLAHPTCDDPTWRAAASAELCASKKREVGFREDVLKEEQLAEYKMAAADILEIKVDEPSSTGEHKSGAADACNCGSQSLPLRPMAGQSPHLSKKPNSTRKMTCNASDARNSEFRLWPLWAADASDVGGDSPRLASSATSTKTQSDMPQKPGSITAVMRGSGLLQALVVGPDTKFRIFWDVTGIIVLAYDVLSVPMIAFTLDEDDTAQSRLLHLITTIFWCLDIPISFFRGFYDGGVLEMRPRMTASRYLKGWFLLDCPVILLDIFSILVLRGHLHEVMGAFRVNKVLRGFRALRLLRLLHLLRLPHWADSFGDYLSSEGLVTALGILRSLLIIVVASHFVACGWYAVGGEERPFTWVQTLDDEGRDLNYRYTTALHWSVSQFTPASMEVVPRNTTERIYCVIVILGAMVAFSCFVSSITQAMANLQRSHLERDRQQSNIRRYTAENFLSLELGNQISSFVKTHQVSARRRVHEVDIHVFKLLPESLRQEMRWQVHAPLLLRHPIFERLLDMDGDFVREVTHKAMSEMSLVCLQELFCSGAQASVAYFARSGVWEYRTDGKDAEPLKVRSDRWMCEVALWLQWECQGTLSAATVCEATSLDAARFHKLVTARPALQLSLRDYAVVYSAKLEGEFDSVAAELGYSWQLLEGIVQESRVHLDSLADSSPSKEGESHISIGGSHPLDWQWGSEEITPKESHMSHIASHMAMKPVKRSRAAGRASSTSGLRRWLGLPDSRSA